MITGEQLGHLSDIQLQLALDAPEIVFARVLAEQKMRIVGALKKKRELVAVTGDGVNDAPALRKADVGIAMGRSGTDVAREAADMVLLDDNFASIVAAIEEGRAVFANIRNFLTYILTSNVPELIPYLAFVIFRIPLPLTIIQILAVDLGTDMLPALGLGAEKPAPDIMKVPPRSRADRLLNWPLLARAYLFLGPMQAAAAMSAYWFVLRNGGWNFGEKLAAHDPLYLQATTACLSAIIVMQIANVFLCRSEREPLLARSLTSNRLILAGIATEILLIALIVYTPWGNALFGTASIELVVWLFIIPFALAMVALEELRKWLVRARSKTPYNCPHPRPILNLVEGEGSFAIPHEAEEIVFSWVDRIIAARGFVRLPAGSQRPRSAVSLAPCSPRVGGPPAQPRCKRGRPTRRRACERAASPAALERCR